MVFFTAAADGFLYNMVRILCGTLLDAVKKPEKFGGIQAILDACDRTQAGITLPPQGLFLQEVVYSHKSYSARR